MANHVVDENIIQDPPVDEQLPNTDADDILKDPMKRSEILKKLGLPNPSALTPSGTAYRRRQSPTVNVVPLSDVSALEPSVWPTLGGTFSTAIDP